MTGAQRGGDVGLAARDRAEAARRRAEERHVGRADHAQSATASTRCDRDTERGRLDHTEAAVRDDHRGPGRGDVLAAASTPYAHRRRRTPGRDRSASCGSRPNGSIGIATRRRAGAARCQRAASGRDDPVGVEDLASRGHAACSPPRRDRDDVGPLEELAQHVLGGMRSVRPSTSRARLPSPVQPWRMSSTTCARDRGAGDLGRAADRAPHARGSTGSGTRPPRRAACHGVAAPAPTTLHGPSRRCSIAATIACAASSGCSTENGGSENALTGTTGSRSSRPSGLGTCEPTTGA